MYEKLLPSRFLDVTCNSYARFPKDEERRMRWINAINTLNKPNWFPCEADRLCSKHFEDKYFNKNNDSKVSLLYDAIPTIFSHTMQVSNCVYIYFFVTWSPSIQISAE